jgi:hypothetical protein
MVSSVELTAAFGFVAICLYAAFSLAPSGSFRALWRTWNTKKPEAKS